jgi:hypothetical protein
VRRLHSGKRASTSAFDLSGAQPGLPRTEGLPVRRSRE